MFNTSEGKKTGAELAAELAGRPEARLDIRSHDGTLEAKVRGGKSIAEGKAENVKRAVEIQRSSSCGSGSGGLASKVAAELENLGANSLSPELKDAIPLLREVGEGGVVEILTGWLSAPAKTRVHGGREHRLFKGVTHLSAMKAIQQYDEVRDGEQTLARHGERVDFTVGKNPLAPLSAARTMMRAIANGGIIDDQTEVREVRVTVDSPDLFFVLDGSGSMAGLRIVAAVSAAQALTDYYAPKGSRFGCAEITGEKPLVRVPPGEPDAEALTSAIIGLEPRWGTAYVPAIEYGIQACQPKTTMLVFGDFEDNGLLSEEARAIKSEKNIKIIGITDATGNTLYANSLCDEVHLVDLSDPTQVALVALKAAE